jgi:hypothetical protein
MKRNHVLITGTGRAGTTFLVHLLTKVGIDTGFNPENIDAFVDQTSFGGLELDIRNVDAPYVAKSPLMSLMLDEILQNDDLILDAVIVPFRSIKEAAASRLDVQSKSGEFFPNSVPGGITTGAGGVDQEQELYLRIERILLSLSRTHIPVIFIAYPLLMQDKEYLYRKLVSVFPSISHGMFVSAFDSIYIPERVHEFGSDAVRRLQNQESTWNHNFVSQIIQQNNLSKEQIEQLKKKNVHLQSELDQVMQSRSVRFTQPMRSLASYARKLFRSR